MNQAFFLRIFGGHEKIRPITGRLDYLSSWGKKGHF